MAGKLYESLTTKFIKNNPYTTTEEVTKTRQDHRKLVKNTIEKAKTSIEKGDLKVTVNDLDKLMRLDLLLMGEPDSNSQVTPGVDGIEQRRLVVSCLEELAPEETDFLCNIMAKIVNQRNVLAEQKQPHKPVVDTEKAIEVIPVEVKQETPKKVVPRAPVPAGKR